MPIELKADAKEPGKPLVHHWSVCVGAGRANEGLRAGWLEHLKLAADACGFRYVRFHGLFHEDMFVYREKDGQPVYNFQYIDDLFDRLLEAGVRPFVEFGFCPEDLADPRPGDIFWWKGRTVPPKDQEKWAELIRRVVAHWIARYGLAEVRQWYFEVWNEPNLNGFFHGTKAEYFQLYKTTALAVKAVEPSLRVGGPATSNFVPDARFDGETEDESFHTAVTKAEDLDALQWKPVWLEQFLAFCAREKLPVDFVSTHPYPTDWPLDGGKLKKFTRGVDATKTDLALLRKIVDAGPYPKAEIHLTEWNSSPSPRDFTHDFPQAATYIVKANVESAGLVDSLAYWTFTDVFEEHGGGNTAFHGGFGMITYQGVPKPAFHAYRFLNALGRETLRSFPGGVVTRDPVSGRIAALAWHYPPEVRQTPPMSEGTRKKALETLAAGDPDTFRIELTGLRPFAPFLVEILDRRNGNALHAWFEMGQPEPPSREQTAILRRVGATPKQETFTADAKGVLVLVREVEPWAVVLVREL